MTRRMRRERNKKIRSGCEGMFGWTHAFSPTGEWTKRMNRLVGWMSGGWKGARRTLGLARFFRIS
jgi:hypothetical protein